VNLDGISGPDIRDHGNDLARLGRGVRRRRGEPCASAARPAAPTPVVGPFEVAGFFTMLTAQPVPAPGDASSVMPFGAGARVGASFHGLYGGLQFTQFLSLGTTCPAWGCVQQTASFYGLEAGTPR